MKVIIDINDPLIPAQFNIDIFSELKNLGFTKLYIVDRTLEELDKIIKEQSLKHRKSAKLALSLLKAKNVKIIKTNSSKDTDSVIAETAKELNYLVATQDLGLKRKLIKDKIKIITLRQKKYLVIS